MNCLPCWHRRLLYKKIIKSALCSWFLKYIVTQPPHTWKTKILHACSTSFCCTATDKDVICMFWAFRRHTNLKLCNLFQHLLPYWQRYETDCCCKEWLPANLIRCNLQFSADSALLTSLQCSVICSLFHYTVICTALKTPVLSIVICTALAALHKTRLSCIALIRMPIW